MSRRIEPYTSGDTSGIIYHAEEGKHSATVIIMHGLGDSADGMASIADLFYISMPHVKFILPSANARPVTMNFGHTMPAWYDIVGLDDRAAESCDGIDTSVERIRGYLQTENMAGLSYSRMALAGFSQGGAMSFFTGLQLPEVSQKLAGLLVMSGYLPGQSQFKLTEGFEDVPILHCHGQADPVVAYTWAEKSKERICGAGIKDYELKGYPGVAHTISMEIIDQAHTFLQRILPHNTGHIVKPKDPQEMGVRELLKNIRASGLASKAAGLSEKPELVALLSEHYAAKYGS